MELFSFLFGLIFGSFLNVLIYRLPINKSFIAPRSRCVHCDNLIPFYHNIPVLSYIILKGKCANCNGKISIVYPIVELITAFITLGLFIKFNLSFEFFTSLIFFYSLIVLSFIDFKYKAVPDYMLLIALVFSFIITQDNLIDAFKNAFIISGGFVLLNFVVTFYIQNIKSRILKDESLKTQEALGEGDIPVLAAFGAILGLSGAFMAIFLSSLFAIIPSLYFHFKKKDIQTPYIPYLSMGLIVEYFFNLSKVFI